MVTLFVHLSDRTNLQKKAKDVVEGAKRGVLLATESGVLWLKEDVFEGQQYVGDSNYPDVTPVTKLIKAKAGNEKVGIWTGNLKTSFKSAVTGLEGKITGVGYTNFLARWNIEALFMDKRGKKSREIIEKEIKGKI